MLKKVYQHCMKFPVAFTSLNLFTLMIYLGEMVIPYAFSQALDHLSQGKTKDLSGLLFLMVLTTLVLLILSYVQTILSNRMSVQVSYDFLDQVDSKLERLPLRLTSKYEPAYLNNRLFNDTITLVEFAINSLMPAVIKVITSLVLFYLIFRIHPLMLLLVVGALVFNTLGILILNKALYKHGAAYKEGNARYHAINNERLTHIKETKIHSWYDQAGQELNQAFSRLFKIQTSFSKILGQLNNVGRFSKNTALILTLLIGLYLTQNQTLSVGQLVLVTTYTSICLTNSESFLKLGQGYQQAYLSYQRLEEFMAEKDDPQGTVKLKTIDSIRIKNLTFAYDNNPPLYKDLCLHLERGKIYCLKGKNGEGKSTLIDLLLGLHHHYSGAISYNQTDIKDLDMVYTRADLVSVILQEPKLNTLSVKDNMTKGLKTYTDESMKSWSELFSMSDLLDQAHTTSLSGGEKQKVAIIRGLLKAHDFLILDEPVSAMDQEGIQALKEALRSIKSEKIILFISHNEQLFDLVDDFLAL